MPSADILTDTSVRFPWRAIRRIPFPVRCIERYDDVRKTWLSRWPKPEDITPAPAGLTEACGQLVNEAWSGMEWTGGAPDVKLVVGAEALVVVLPGERVVQVSADVAEEIGLVVDGKLVGDAWKAPFLMLLNLAGTFVAAVLADDRTGGSSPKAALVKVLEAWESMDRAERTPLLRMLESPKIDSGHIFRNFLVAAVDESRREEVGETPEIWRERWATWIIGQAKVDLPYDREAAEEVLSADMEPDDMRLALHQVVQDYDSDADRANAERINRQVAWGEQELIFGRMSRAFHNQGALFAHARHLTIDDEMSRAAEKLASVTTWPEIRPAVDRVRLLAQPGREAPMTELAGALDYLEEQTLRAQRVRAQKALQHRRMQIETATPDRKAEERAAKEVKEVMRTSEAILQAAADLRNCVVDAPARRAAYVIMNQRIFPPETHILAKINQGYEPYPGKIETLKRLARLVADQLYSAPTLDWLTHATHWIEAIPLFIKERIRVVDGQETTETVIDQAAMEESFREFLAAPWAQNLRRTELTSYCALARALLLEDDAASADLSQTADLPRAWRMKEDDRTDEVARLAAAISVAADSAAFAISELHEKDEDSDRLACAQSILLGTSAGGPLWSGVRQAAESTGWLKALESSLPSADDKESKAYEAALADITPLSDLPRRPLPTMHVLTTQSANMTDGYVRSWIEENMALANVIRAEGLTDAVKAKQALFDKEIETLGEALIAELGLGVEVDTIAATEQISRSAAVKRVIGANRMVQEQVALLGVLREFFGIEEGSTTIDPPAVDEVVDTHRAELEAAAMVKVIQRNSHEIELRISDARREGASEPDEVLTAKIVKDDPDYSADLLTFVRFGAREKLLAMLDEEDSANKLAERRATWLRSRQRLTKTTASKLVIAEAGLNHLTMDPRYYYQAAGGSKRFNLLYTPSRVDLGPRERESVETWSQWVGGCDRKAAQTGRKVYSLINKAVKRFDSLTEPEVLKTGENASMASHLAYANAMALMVDATGRGDMEELGDQMSLREDRTIHAAGEGYGGYCVPKDGLFLEFVLTLSEGVKLQQLGIEERDHAAVSDLAYQVLLKRDEFPTELAWQAWAEKLLADQDAMKKVFQLRTRTGEDGETVQVPVYQITRLAKVLNNLGQPPLREHKAVVHALAARWGIHTMIAGGEHVNRFMPFYKVWMTYDALEKSRASGNSRLRLENAVIVLSAEYKPNTQDGRFSVGMRKYEIYAKTGDHLRYSLGSEAGTLAKIMIDGWDATMESHGVDDAGLQQLVGQWGLDAADPTTGERMAPLFPGFPVPGELRLVSTMGLATQDVLRYHSDTTIEQIADALKEELYRFGLDDDDIAANMDTFGPRLDRWATLRDNPAAKSLFAKLDGNVHALALAMLGPERSYERALQGADVFDVGISHTEVMALLETPARVRDLMLYGHPNSALIIVDGGSGARRRAMSRRGVMRWFAVGDQVGRESIYRAVGLGESTVESWRKRMRNERDRAHELRERLAAKDAEGATTLFGALVSAVRDEQEALLTLEEEERLVRFKRDSESDHAVSHLLTEVARMASPEQLTFAHWLAIGGAFILEGSTEAELLKAEADFSAATDAIFGTNTDNAAQRELMLRIITPAVKTYGAPFRQEGGVESSNKATEEVNTIALNTRRQLAERAKRVMALRARATSFEDTMQEERNTNWTADTLTSAIRDTLGAPEAFDSDKAFGRIIALTRILAELLVDTRASDDERDEVRRRFRTMLDGQELDPDAVRQVCGGYEDIGAIGRLAQTTAATARNEGWSNEARRGALDEIASLAEFIDVVQALEATLTERQKPTGEADAPGLWRNLATFFAETLNDHFYDYRPWAYARGIGFEEYQGDDLFELSDRHHRWLYGYLRNLVTGWTELSERSSSEQDLLLGNLTDGGVVVAIGATGHSVAEERWRVYNQLRELAFIRNDGFRLPPVFDGFDPALIDAENRVNIVPLYPVGRTHISRLLAEGPTLAKELKAAGRKAANILLTRQGHVEGDHLVINDAHFYVDKETCAAALKARGDGANAQARAEADAGPKGVRIAARFSKPVIAALPLPMHGNPVYDEGHLERMGIPYGVQSRFHTWTTYDKAKYPDIFTPDTGVIIPGEIDWLHEWTDKSKPAEMIRQIRTGTPDGKFEGLEAFARKHRIVMIKDAAESGGRSQKAFEVRRPDGTLIDDAIQGAAEFLHQISLNHNVAVQEVILTSPETWATEEFLRRFTDRQIMDWSRAIIRDRQPPTPMFGSFRVILSTDSPTAGNRKNLWHVSHPITLNSTQLITNVGRGGTLDILQPTDIRPEHSADIISTLHEAGRLTMEAMAAYESRTAERYESETGEKIGHDLTGLSYGMPRYLMLDFLLRPVFSREGELVEVIPDLDDDENRIGSKFLLRHGDEVFEGEIAGWEAILIEPNIGIGLWDRVAIREEVHEQERAATEGREMDWSRVGENARIVLRDFAQAGADYLDALTRTSGK